MLLDFLYSSLFEHIWGSIKMFYFKSMALEKLFTNSGINKFTNLWLIVIIKNISVLAAIDNKTQNTEYGFFPGRRVLIFILFPIEYS